MPDALLYTRSDVDRLAIERQSQDVLSCHVFVRTYRQDVLKQWRVYYCVRV